MPKKQPKEKPFPTEWDLYLTHYPSADGTKTLANITAFEGKKKEECPPRFSFTKGVRLAGLYRVTVTSREQLMERVAEAARAWIVPVELDPGLKAYMEQQEPSSLVRTTELGECPPGQAVGAGEA